MIGSNDLHWNDPFRMQINEYSISISSGCVIHPKDHSGYLLSNLRWAKRIIELERSTSERFVEKKEKKQPIPGRLLNR
jgi:hypothetical protein